MTIHTARPGIVIGKKGEDVERLRADVSRLMGVPVHINIEEIHKPELMPSRRRTSRSSSSAGFSSVVPCAGYCRTLCARAQGMRIRVVVAWAARTLHGLKPIGCQAASYPAR